MQVGSRERRGIPGHHGGYDSEDDAEDVLPDRPVVPPSHLVNERAMRLEQQAVRIRFSASCRNLMKDMLDEVYGILQPKQSDWEARELVIQFIEKFVKYKIAGSSISAFGSFVMDLFTASSDLDLSLNLSDGRRDRPRNDKVHYLRKVANSLYGLQKGQRTVRGIETVYRAAVPVVKFVECKTGIECDISVENNDGVLKSRVLGLFATIDPRFRQLCYLVKAWAKKHNVNSSKNGTLNSLSICLLVAFHLQTCSPPILPPFSVFMEDLYLPSVENCLRIVADRVKSIKDDGYGSDNLDSVPELFGSFFVKMVAVESLWEQGLCSSTYEGRWISKIWPKNHIGCISVEDFADRTQNVARSVSRKEFELIYQCLHSTLSNLKDPVKNVMDTKDLRAYLFGSVRQRHRSSDYAKLAATCVGSWQGGNGWLSSVDNRSNLTSHTGYLPHMDVSFHNNHNQAHLVSSQTAVIPTAGYVHPSQAGPGFTVPGNGHGENGVDPQMGSFGGRVRQHSHIDSRSSPVVMNVTHVDVVKRGFPSRTVLDMLTTDGHREVVDMHPVDGYRDGVEAPTMDVYGIVDGPNADAYRGPSRDVELDRGYMGTRHVYREGQRLGVNGLSGYPNNGRMVYVEPTQAGRVSYSAVDNRPRGHHPGGSGQGTSNSHQNQRRHGRGNRARMGQTPGLSGNARPGSINGYQPHGVNSWEGYWQGQAPSNPQEFLIR